jgi:hypothetical protein
MDENSTSCFDKTFSDEACCQSASLLSRFLREQLHIRGQISVVILSDNHHSRATDTIQQRKNRTKRHHLDSQSQCDEMHDLKAEEKSALLLCQRRGKSYNKIAKKNAVQRPTDLPPKRPSRQSSASSLKGTTTSSTVIPPPPSPPNAQFLSSPTQDSSSLISIASRWKCKESSRIFGKCQALPQKPKRNVSNSGEVLSLASLVLGVHNSTITEARNENGII